MAPLKRKPAQSKKHPKGTIPRAHFSKRFIHTFYLVQPILQFLMLVIMIGVLSRCSPLASSKNRQSNETTSSTTVEKIEESSASKETAKRELIESNMTSLGETDLEAMKESDYSKVLADTVSTDEHINEEKMMEITRSRNNLTKRKRLISLPIDDSKREALLNGEKVQIDLSVSDDLNMDHKAHKIFMNELTRGKKKHNLKAHLAMAIPDSSFQEAYENIDFSIDVALSLPNEEIAVLQISRNAESKTPALVEAAVQESKELSLILE